MLIVHHLGHSQSDRVVWLCEELGLEYTLQKYDRSPIFAPPSYKNLHPIGSAPVIEDTAAGVKIAESAACMEYIAHVHGGGKFTVAPGAANYADYLYWFHFGNGTLQPAVSGAMMMRFAGLPADNARVVGAQERIAKVVGLLDERLAGVEYLAGGEFTLPDMLVVWSLTGMREFAPMDLSAYPHVLAWLGRVSGREGWKVARSKGDPDVEWEALVKGPSPPLFGPLRSMF